MKKIKVLVADDHPVFRDGLCRLLQDEEDIDVVGLAGDGEEAVQLAEELMPDVAIIDVTMPKVSGIGAARQIKTTCPDTAIIMISAYGYESYMLASFRAGAAGYVLKNAPLQDLLTAVRMANAGQGVFDLKTINKVMQRLDQDDSRVRKASHELQRRELEVLKLAAKGDSNREIAEALVVSERTVQTHMVNIFKKLGVTSRTEAVLRALREGWITLDDLA